MAEEFKRSAPLLLSSDAIDERDRFDAWREELMLRVIRVDVDLPDRRNFRTRLRVLNLSNVAIIERRSTPSLVKRTVNMVRDGDDALVFSLPWRNLIEVRAHAEMARARPGEAIITSLNEVSSLGAPDGVRGVSLRIGRATARSLAPDAERILNCPIPLDRSAFSILSAYLLSAVVAALAFPFGGPTCGSAGSGIARAYVRSGRRLRARRSLWRASGLRGCRRWFGTLRFVSPNPISAQRRSDAGFICRSATSSNWWRAPDILFLPMSGSCGSSARARCCVTR